MKRGATAHQRVTRTIATLWVALTLAVVSATPIRFDPGPSWGASTPTAASAEMPRLLRITLVPTRQLVVRVPVFGGPTFVP